MNIMRGRSNDYCFIDPMIIDILKKLETPVQALNINFKINEMSGRIINLNAVKRHLEDLVEKKRIIKNTNKDEIVFYSLKK